MDIKAKLKVVVRIDDVCPTMDWKYFEKTISLIESYGIKGLLGVIPDSKDFDMIYSPERKDFWEYIKKLEKKGWVLAMHGCHHIYDTQAKGKVVAYKKGSEFAGKSYEEQYGLILLGCNALEKHNINTKIFFAPAHNYDDNTLKALAANGFLYMSDGRSRRPYKRCGIWMIPTNRFPMKGVATIVCHPSSHNNSNSQHKYNEYKLLLEKYKANLVDYRVLMKNLMKKDSLSAIWGGIAMIDESVFVKYSRLRYLGSALKRSLIKR